jgi:secondary thiamine-phosphate synthase enzyme
MTQSTRRLVVSTKGQGLYEISGQVIAWVRETGMKTGLLTIFIQHTSASLTIQENADPDVIADLNEHFRRLAPEDDKLYRHTVEGPDDMPAHIRAALTDTQLSIPVIDGRPVLGTWQGIYVFEHRRAAHRRNVVLHLLGE